jgi:hypothetical protein
MTVSDLSPDALARLEAKLVADLEMVRRVRALLEEHRPGLWPVAGQGSAAVPMPAAESTVVMPAEPRKSMEEALMEGLHAMPESGFRLEDLRRAVAKIIRNHPRGPVIKTFINRMMRKGSVIVLESRSGRGGSSYRCTLPKPVAAEKAADPVDLPPDSLHSPSGGVHSPSASSHSPEG